MNGLNFTTMKVTASVILACICMFFLQMFNSEILYKFGLYGGSLMQQGVYRLFTYAFLHGGLYHIMMNMVSFSNMGMSIEPSIGAKKYCLLLFVTLITSGLAVIFLSRPGTITVGLSGVIFGVFGYYVSTLVISGSIQNEYIRSSILRILLPNVIISLMPGVSWQGHLGGFIGGFVFGLLMH